MTATAYQKAPGQYPDTATGPDAGGSQQAANQSVIGFDAALVPQLVNQGIGLPAAPAGLEPWDGSIP